MHILLNRGTMFDIATRMSRSISILLRYFDLIIATQQNRLHTSITLQKSTRTWKASQPTSGNSDRALIIIIIIFICQTHKHKFYNTHTR